MDALLYIHGKGGSASEADRFRPLFPGYEVVGLDYQARTPWEAEKEFQACVCSLKERCRSVILVANSVGAYFAMNAGIGEAIRKAFFISPVVNMEQLIGSLMERADVTEKELKERGVVHTDFDSDLSWEYLTYVREHPLKWDVPTDVLYGGRDQLIPSAAVRRFAAEHRARLTVMENGEHWFHTREQLAFLDRWIGNGIERMERSIAYCGLDCSRCDAYLATVNNDRDLREKTAALWSRLNRATITADQINCEGCRANGAKTVYCENICEIRKCALQRGLGSCGACGEMENCQTVGAVIRNAPSALKNLKA